MPSSDLDPLGRILGTAPDPRDAAVAGEALAVAAALQRVPVPPGTLTGWRSLCAGEYAEAVRVLHRRIALAEEALAAAARAAR